MKERRKAKSMKNCLEYPFDADYILSKKKRIKRELLASGREFIDKKIAILGGSTTNDIKLIMELFLLNYGIRSQFYESEYNQYYQDAMFDNPVLEEFNPDIIYVHTTNRNITRYPVLADTKDDIDSLIDAEMRKFTEMWDRLRKVYGCPIIQNDFEMPMYRLLGNKDASDIHGSVNFITRLNMSFYDYAQAHENFFICNLSYISADYGLEKWSDPFYWYMYKYALNVSAIPYLSFNVANIIKSIFGKNKKGFVIDLDNTLWGGVIGDDGADNIQIGQEEPTGQAYCDFQEYLKLNKDMGLVLNINSKNDVENAIAGLNHPEGVLRPDDFIVIKANWNSKDMNFKEIAEELNVLPESLVFIDDNPAERHIVSEQIPGVSAPEIGEIYQYVRNIDRSGFFEMTSFSADDRKRTEMYRENKERAKLQASYADYHEYLLSLEMKAVIKEFEPVYMQRIAQLTNKSNQFNLTTKRYSQSEIEEIALDREYITLYGKLEDRFGDNGVVSVIIGHCVEMVCHIDLWLMSCRVLKRDMELAMMDALIHKCMQRGIKLMRGYYYPTAKNSMVRELYGLLGFYQITADEAGNSVWEYDCSSNVDKKNTVIVVEE